MNLGFFLLVICYPIVHKQHHGYDQKKLNVIFPTTNQLAYCWRYTYGIPNLKKRLLEGLRKRNPYFTDFHLAHTYMRICRQLRSRMDAKRDVYPDVSSERPIIKSGHISILYLFVAKPFHKGLLGIWRFEDKYTDKQHEYCQSWDQTTILNAFSSPMTTFTSTPLGNMRRWKMNYLATLKPISKSILPMGVQSKCSDIIYGPVLFNTSTSFIPNLVLVHK